MWQNRFNELFNEMFFNILANKPHASVFYFVERYFPHMTDPTPAEWTIYPPGQFEYEEPQRTEHNLFFEKHPFFDIQFSEGMIRFSAAESKNYLPRVTKADLLLFFEDKQGAELAFRELAIRFKAVSKKKKTIRKKGKKIMLFTDQQVIDDYNCVQLMLTKDGSSEKKYKILFTYGYDTDKEDKTPAAN